MIKKSFLHPKIDHYFNDFFDESINFLSQEVIEVHHTVLYGLYNELHFCVGEQTVVGRKV